MKLRYFALLILTSVALGDAENTAALKQSYTLEGQKNYEGAIRSLAPLYNAAPSDFFLNLRLGWLNYLNGNYKNALTHYEAAVKAQSKSLTALQGKFTVFSLQGRLDEAEAMARAIAGLQPQGYSAHLQLANNLIAQKKYQEAVETLAVLLPLYPESLELLNTMTWAQKLSGDRAGAARTSQRALAISPDNAIAQAHARDLAKKGATK